MSSRVSGGVQNLSPFFGCPQAMKQGCLLIPLISSLLILAVAMWQWNVRNNEKHGIQLLPSLEEKFLLSFADDIVLVSSTPSGLQNLINNLEKASNSKDCYRSKTKSKDIKGSKELYLLENTYCCLWQNAAHMTEQVLQQLIMQRSKAN